MSAGIPPTSFPMNAPTALDEEFQQDVIAGLSGQSRTLPCKYFYDARGSELFDRICELDEYYPTRTELSIMQQQIDDIAAAIGSDCMLIEFGSGSSLKTQLILEHLTPPLTYVPVDISGEHLAKTAEDLQDCYQHFEISPIEADFTQPLDEKRLPEHHSRRVIYFPGSTIGNFTKQEAVQLLKQMRELAGSAGSVIVGIDLKKDVSVLEAAYDDAEGVTAEFNLNLLSRINEELDGDFDLNQFRHEAVWSETFSRIEMHLVSECEQTVTIDGDSFAFEDGETIHTENSHKYSLDCFRQMAAESELSIENVWTDPHDWFAVIHCRVD